MTEHRQEGPGENGDPIPRDMPDQQAYEGEDPWDARPAPGGADEGEPATDVPDTDEAGTGRQGAPRSETVHPEHPDPEESSA
ncbi:hypothetical protein [Streptomyces sp. NBC_00996]|uniref:hypothetical protein n=1 Tax=Streptomyces sp. NBC_00996 TaxID=2903710 RepID=UPI0038709A14|nr:hypothetical protein OG390_46470 [Streptomyces sp. NBC_00996]